MKKITILVLASVTFLGCGPFFATKYQLSINETLSATELGQQEEISILEADTVVFYTRSLFPRIRSSGKVRHGRLFVHIQSLKTKTSVLSKRRISRRVYIDEYSHYLSSIHLKHSLNSASSSRSNTPTTGAVLRTGPRGGRYYINSNGNKTYVKKGATNRGYSSSRRTKSYASKSYSKSSATKSSMSSSKYKSNSTRSGSSGSKSGYRSTTRR